MSIQTIMKIADVLVFSVKVTRSQIATLYSRTGIFCLMIPCSLVGGFYHIVWCHRPQNRLQYEQVSVAVKILVLTPKDGETWRVQELRHSCWWRRNGSLKNDSLPLSYMRILILHDRKIKAKLYTDERFVTTNERLCVRHSHQCVYVRVCVRACADVRTFY
jgi:hypothetical protein